MPHPSHDAPGTLRRAPAPSFAHALLLEQGDAETRWQISDLYGLMDNTLATDDEVATWPVVYIPAPANAWADKTSNLPAHPTSLDEQETTR
jgi:hypothetical protein